MIKDRYGVVHEEERNTYEKEWQMNFGYKFVTFNYREAEDICKGFGKGYIVEKISTTPNRINERTIIYRAY